MVGKSKRGLLALCLACLSAAWTILPAQNDGSGQVDSLLRLEKADYVQQIEQGDNLVRKVVNPVFLHNGTYLECDSSLWYLSTNIINCLGNVVMTQGDAVLTSDKLDYIVDDNLAKFRGELVELRNKQGNILRTQELDYNTRDSLAVFRNGASMRSEDGQIIESDDGTYSNPLNYFTFSNNVNMFTDSVFVSTSELDYDSDGEVAIFKAPIDFWKEENMLSASRGWYRRGDDTFFFRGNVRALGKTQETWSDTLYYYRKSGDVKMLGNVQLQDTSRSVASVSKYLYYSDSLSSVTLLGEAAIALWEKRGEAVDTTYCGADTILYRGVRMCDIPSEEIELARQRKETILTDPVAEYRQRAAEERARKEKEARDKAIEEGLMSPGAASGAATKDTGTKVEGQPKENGTTPEESGSTMPAADSLALNDSSLVAGPPEPLDTTSVGFVSGIGNVRIFRSDMQVRCDSLEFNELDSVARFYREPKVWNETRRQYTADSLFVLVKKNGIDRASLMSNSFIAVEEDSTHYDQISSSEGLAYFDDSTQLRRFDALGNVSAIFYLEENDVLSTVNKSESTMMSAILKDGELQSVHYFENPKNDAYPIVQLSEREQMLKGLQWYPELRPKAKSDVTTLKIRRSARALMLAKLRPTFPRTESYFEGYMSEVYASLEAARLSRERADSVSASMPADSVVTTADSLAQADTMLFADSLLHGASMPQTDSLAASSSASETLSERELKRQERIAARERRWAELDARDARKQAEREARAEKRRLRREERLERRRERQRRKEEALLQRYIELYEKQKEKDERQQKSEPARERTSGIETGGELQPSIELEEQTP